MVRCPEPDCAYRCLRTDTCDCYLMTGKHHVIKNGKCSEAKVGVLRFNPNGVVTVIQSERPKWRHHDEMMELYLQGMTDSEIGKKVGVSTSMVNQWRKRNQLPSADKLEENEFEDN